MRLLEVNNLSVSYKTGYKSNVALNNVNLEVNSGEYVFVIGDNGTGKSTLLKCILGLIKEKKGSINLNCKSDEISYIPQLNTIPLEFPATVFEIVLTGTQKSGFSFPFYKKSDKIAAQKAICDVGLENFVNRRIGELSGGQRQRVLLARALCKKPKLLISDEPCTGLDKKTTDDFYNILNNFNKKNNTTIIMVSHDLVNLKKYATRVIKLENKVVFDGNVSALLKIKENLI